MEKGRSEREMERDAGRSDRERERALERARERERVSLSISKASERPALSFNCLLPCGTFWRFLRWVSESGESARDLKTTEDDKNSHEH
jgi:hypothetical protein